MKVLKKLLFLACLVSIGPMLGMHKLVENEQDLTESQKNQYSDIMNTVKDSETLNFERFSVDDIVREQADTYYCHSYYPKDEKYLKEMNQTKVLDFIRFYSKQDPEKITRLHCFINYTNLERPIRQKIHNEYFTALTNTDLKNNQLQKKIEELTKQNKEREKKINDFRIFFNCDEIENTLTDQMEVKFSEQLINLTEENKQQKLEIEKLTKQNQQQKEELKNFRMAANVRKSTNSAKQEEQPRSWFQRNNLLLSRLSVATVMGGCMLLGASLYSFFAK